MVNDKSYLQRSLDDGTFRFGKHKGKEIKVIVQTKHGRNYLQWLIASEKQRIDDIQACITLMEGYLTASEGSDIRSYLNEESKEEKQ